MSNPVVEDPRIDPRIKRMFADWTPLTLPDVPSREALLAMMANMPAAHAEATPLLPDESLYEAIASSNGLAIRTERIVSAPDGNVINLQIVAPTGDGPWPCVYYIHGGGMMQSSCYDANYRAWGRMIARFGVMVVMVDFRNALVPSSVPEIAPFPAGLNDCVSGLRWVHRHATTLDVDPGRIIILGESGGANLTLATALKLKLDGDLDKIAGLYAMCPYLAGEWTGSTGSAIENRGILMDVRSNYGAMAYGIEALQARDPLAWPGFATEEDVAGFPPVVVAVNECDPLRDDGIGFYRLLLRAGVAARCRNVLGTVHGTEIYILCCPDISRDAARDIAAFCRGG
jgi:acetyl esterase